MTDRRVTTGFNGLDEILDGLRIGDNVVWKVDSIDDYRYFVMPYVNRALARAARGRLFSLRPAPPVVIAELPVKISRLDPREGFEPFACCIHAVATEKGVGVFYVFDCLSDLLSAWVTDHMIANFFLVTCPYLFRLDTVAYFALLRNQPRPQNHCPRFGKRPRSCLNCTTATGNAMFIRSRSGRGILQPCSCHTAQTVTVLYPCQQS